MTRPSPNDTRTQIVEILGESVLHALGLKETLQNERRALEEQNIDELDQAVTTKSDCVGKLQQLESQRQALCEASGFHPGPDQMEQLVDWCDEDSVITRCWSQLMDIAADCNALNLTNGAIIQMRSQMMASNLAVLRGGEPQPDTYRRQGRDSAANKQRSLAEA